MAVMSSLKTRDHLTSLISVYILTLFAGGWYFFNCRLAIKRFSLTAG